MSGYSRSSMAATNVPEPEVHEQEEASGAEEGAGHGGDKHDGQYGGQEQVCALQNIKISNVCSLSQGGSHYNSSVAAWFDVGQQGPVVERPADTKNYKMPSELDEECIFLDTDAVSISSDESDCNVRQVGAWMSENVSAKECNIKGKSPKRILSSDVTTEGGASKKPKLSVCSTVSYSMSKLENSRICVESSAKVEFLKNSQNNNNVQLHLAATILSPSNETKKVLDAAQSVSNLRSPQKDTGENLIQSKQTIVARNKTSSIVYPKETRIETPTRNSEDQRKSSSSVRPMTVPSDNHLKNVPEKKGNKSSCKEFCCTLSWSAYMYGIQLQCTCLSPAGATEHGLGCVAGSSSANQLTLEQKYCKDDVCLVKNLNKSINTVKKGSTSTPQDQFRLPCEKRHESNYNSEVHIQNKQKSQTNILDKRSEVGRRKLKRANKHSKREQEDIVNPVLELKTSNKSRANNQKKAQPSDIQLNREKEVESRSVDTYIVLSSSESDSDVKEVEVSVLENKRKDHPKKCISQEITLSSSVSKLDSRKVCNDANVGKADVNKNTLNIDHLKLNSKPTGAIPSYKPKQVLDIAQSHQTFTSHNNDDEKYSVQSEQNKFTINERNPCVQPKPTDTRTRGSIVHGYQGTGPEPPKEKYQKATGAMPYDKARKVLEVAQGHRAVTSLKDYGKKKSFPSEQDKFVRNKGGSSYVHPEQTDTFTRGFVVHSYQSSGLEPPKKNSQKTTGEIESDKPRKVLDVAQGNRTSTRHKVHDEKCSVQSKQNKFTRNERASLYVLPKPTVTFTREPIVHGYPDTGSELPKENCPKVTGAILYNKPRKVLDVAPGHRTGHKNDGEKSQVQSEQNKFIRNKVESSYVHPEQTDILTRGSVVHSYQDTGPEPPKKNSQKATGEIQSDKTRKVLDVAEGHRTVTSLKNDSEKYSALSEQNKFVRNEGESSYVHPEQTDRFTKGSVMRSYQGTRPEPPKKNCQKATGAIPSDKTRKVLDVVEAVTRLKDDGEKESVQSEQNKFTRNKGGTSYVHQEQTDILTRGSVVHSYQDTGPEPPKNNCQKATGAMASDKTSKVLDVAEGHRTVTSLKNDSEKYSVYSEQNKLMRNEGGSSYVHPEQTDTLTKGSVVHSYQGTGLKPPIKNCKKTTGEILSDKTNKVLEVDHRNDSEENSVQSEQNKFARNEGGSSYEQTDTLTRKSVVHTYEDTETPKKNCRHWSKIIYNIHNDCKAATLIDEVLQDTQLEEQSTLHPENKFGLHDDKRLNESGEAGCVHGHIIVEPCNKMFSEVLTEHQIASDIEEIQEQFPASLDINTESHNQVDQEYQLNWTDQLSEIITHFPLGIQDKTTGRTLQDKETVINHKDCSKEDIGTCPDNGEDLIKQFDEEYKSLHSTNRSNNLLHRTTPSHNESNNKTAGKTQNDIYSKEFCCISSWSAYLCGEQSKCLCTSVSHITKKPTDKTTQYTPAGRSESTFAVTDTFASPKLDMNKSKTDKKRGRSKKGCSKYEDSSQLHLKKVEQSLTDLDKNLLVKKNKKDPYVSPKKTITPTTIDSGLDVRSKTESSESFKNGSFSLESDNVGSSGARSKCVCPAESISSFDFKVPCLMSKEVQPKPPKNKRHLPDDMTRPKKRKRSSIPWDRSKGECPEKSNSSLELEISEQTTSSERAAEHFSSPAADKSESEMSAQDIHNVQEANKVNLKKRYRNTKRSTKTSLPTMFLDLDMNTGSQLRTLDAKQKISKYDDTLVNKVIENTPSMINEDFTLQSAVQKLTEETHQKKPKKQTRKKNQLVSTESMKTHSASRKRSQEESGLHISSATVNSSDRMGIEQHTKIMDNLQNCLEKVAAPTSDAAEQELSKYVDTLVNKVIENTPSMVNEDFTLLPAVQKLTDETHQEKPRKQFRKKKQLIPTHSSNRMGAEQHKKSMYNLLNCPENMAPPTSDVEVKTVDAEQELSNYDNTLVNKVTENTPSMINEDFTLLSAVQKLTLQEKPMKQTRMKKQLVPTESMKTHSASRKRSQVSSQEERGLHVSSATVDSSDRMGIEQPTKTMDNLQNCLEKVAPPSSEVEVKTVDASCCCGLTEQSTPKRKMHIKQCFLRLCRLAVPLEGQFPLGNMGEK